MPCSASAAIELIRDLMSYDVRPRILRGLVKLLRPSKDDIDSRPEILDGKMLSVCNLNHILKKIYSAVFRISPSIERT